MSRMKKHIGLYIHIPFCKSFCPYCDFYKVHPTKELIEKYTEAVVKTTASFSDEYEFVVDSVYFGGGTPSIVPGKNIAEILSSVRENCEVTEDAEITVECNPSSPLEEVLPILYKAGVNRLSFGLQSASDGERKKLGRLSGRERMSSVTALAREIGFRNISLDIMVGIPGQTRESLIDTLNYCISSDITHISAYMLKIEDGTVFSKCRDMLELPDEDTVCDFYDILCDKLPENGFHQYEISNFARSGYESRHNLKYWNCEEYIGIGPAAHSFIDGKRFFYDRDINAFIENPSPIFDSYGGSYEEWLMLKLRLNEGVRDISLLRPETVKRAKDEKLSQFVILDDDGLRLTHKGFLLSNTIISELIL